jgi:hypothetical protein
VDQDLPNPRGVAPDGVRFLLRENASVLVIVPGDRTVTARCDHCWRYGNPRDFAEVRLGGRKNAYSGTCLECDGERS